MTVNWSNKQIYQHFPKTNHALFVLNHADQKTTFRQPF